jgi:hypothetical protein
MPVNVIIPPKLEAISEGRDHIKTAEFARVFNVTSETVRKNYCLTGSCYGIRPLKFGRDLLWPILEVAHLLNGGE